jgi:hypothetical protein
MFEHAVTYDTGRPVDNIVRRGCRVYVTYRGDIDKSGQSTNTRKAMGFVWLSACLILN